MASPASCFLLWHDKQTQALSLSLFTVFLSHTLAHSNSKHDAGGFSIVAAVVMGCRGIRGKRKEVEVGLGMIMLCVLSRGNILSFRPGGD